MPGCQAWPLLRILCVLGVFICASSEQASSTASPRPGRGKQLQHTMEVQAILEAELGAADEFAASVAATARASGGHRRSLAAASRNAARRRTLALDAQSPDGWYTGDLDMALMASAQGHVGEGP